MIPTTKLPYIVRLFIFQTRILPFFTFCPSDITIVTTEYEKRLIWEEPRVKDNDDLFPKIRADKVPGSIFKVPGSYEIMYSVTDRSGNEAKCIFRITLKSK